MCRNSQALSCETEPYFTTIAGFVSNYSGEIQTLFEKILLICLEQGLLGNELFAIDDCKLPSNASKEWPGTFKELSDKRAKLKGLIRYHLQQHHSRDQAQTETEVDLQLREAQMILRLR